MGIKDRGEVPSLPFKNVGFLVSVMHHDKAGNGKCSGEMICVYIKKGIRSYDYEHEMIQTQDLSAAITDGIKDLLDATGRSRHRHGPLLPTRRFGKRSGIEHHRHRDPVSELPGVGGCLRVSGRPV